MFYHLTIILLQKLISKSVITLSHLPRQNGDKIMEDKFK